MTDECMCPLRPGQSCKLCEAASGPENCPAVYLVMSDPDLRDQLDQLWSEWRAEQENHPPPQNHSDG